MTKPPVNSDDEYNNESFEEEYSDDDDATEVGTEYSSGSRSETESELRDFKVHQDALERFRQQQQQQHRSYADQIGNYNRRMYRKSNSQSSDIEDEEVVISELNDLSLPMEEPQVSDRTLIGNSSRNSNKAVEHLMKYAFDNTNKASVPQFSVEQVLEKDNEEEEEVDGEEEDDVDDEGEQENEDEDEHEDVTDEEQEQEQEQEEDEDDEQEQEDAAVSDVYMGKQAKRYVLPSEYYVDSQFEDELQSQYPVPEFEMAKHDDACSDIMKSQYVHAKQQYDDDCEVLEEHVEEYEQGIDPHMIYGNSEEEETDPTPDCDVNGTNDRQCSGMEANEHIDEILKNIIKMQYGEELHDPEKTKEMIRSIKNKPEMFSLLQNLDESLKAQCNGRDMNKEMMPKNKLYDKMGSVYAKKKESKIPQKQKFIENGSGDAGRFLKPPSPSYKQQKVMNPVLKDRKRIAKNEKTDLPEQQPNAQGDSLLFLRSDSFSSSDENKIQYKISSGTPTSFNSDDYALHVDILRRPETNTSDKMCTSSSPLGFRNIGRKSFSFTNEQLREIERQNKILLRKMMSSKPTVTKSPQRAAAAAAAQKKQSPEVNARTTSAAVNRKNQQRKIEMENAALQRKLKAINTRRRIF